MIGVLPRGFKFPLEFQSRTTAEIVQPIQTNRSMPVRGSHGQYAVGRLRPGITPELVTGELQALTTRWTTEGLYPEAMRFTAFAVPLVDEVSGTTALGRSDADAPEIDGIVRVKGAKGARPGDFLEARIVAAGEHDLQGAVAA